MRGHIMSGRGTSAEKIQQKGISQKMKKLYFLMLFLFPVLMPAEVKTLVDVDFSKEKDLSGWQFWDKKKFPECFKIQEGILRTSPKELGGLSMTLPQTVEINKSVKKVVMKVEMKQIKNPARIITFALSTAKTPCPGYAAPFRNPGEGGVYFSVCYFNSQNHQKMGWRNAGKEVIRTRPALKPFNMTDADQWVTLTFTIDNEKKILTLQSSLGRSFSLHNVDLDGMTLNSLFIPAMGVSYKTVKFSVEK